MVGREPVYGLGRWAQQYEPQLLGLFVLPASRREDRLFRDWIVENEPTWTLAMRRPSRYADAPDDIWHTTPAPWPSSPALPHRVGAFHSQDRT